MSADRHSAFGTAAQAILDGTVSVDDQHRILCFLLGYLEGNEEFRDALTREVYFYLYRNPSAKEIPLALIPRVIWKPRP